MNLLEADQELANQLLKKLISLKLDLAAHVSVLRNSEVRDQSGNLLDWKKMVQRHRDDLNSTRAESLYSDISKRFLSSKPLPAESLQALIDLIDRRTPLDS